VFIDEEIHTFYNRQAEACDAFLYGRGMYDLMSAYWPTADSNPSSLPVEVEFSRIWKAIPKIVFSKTLDRVEWNSRLVKSEEIKKLKAQNGKPLGIGGPTLAASLIQHGLVDEFHLMVNPVVLGSGKPFFPILDKPLNLQLVETRNFKSGVVGFDFIRLDLRQIMLLTFYQMLMDLLTMLTSTLVPSTHRALIQEKRLHYRLNRAAVC
jgi:dihydrofolate reductase